MSKKRSASNVYSLFEQKQIQEYKEAFGLMDQDRDGVVSVDDLREVFSSLGKVPKDAELKAMVDEAPGPLSFTMLLQLFSERLGGTDEESTLINAFKLYDNSGSGSLAKD
jgi:Ca2+-binding EF-hand superfamily protein